MLKPNEKKILGWGGQLGKRFIENVVVDFAKGQGIEGDPKQLIAECIDPLVILGKASKNIREANSWEKEGSQNVMNLQAMKPKSFQQPKLSIKQLLPNQELNKN